jgi:hypothetical protein
LLLWALLSCAPILAIRCTVNPDSLTKSISQQLP